MDFNLNEQQRALKETARKFAEKELIDVAKEIEKNDTPPGKDILKRFSVLRHILSMTSFPIEKLQSDVQLTYFALFPLERVLNKRNVSEKRPIQGTIIF